MAKLSEHGIRLSSISRVFLNSNSTSHTWPFSAVAELVDNSSDPGVCARQMWIDVVTESETLCLTFTDNGNGMTPNKLHKMLSFGFTEKGFGKAGHQAIGVYGNGFKSGSMRLGRDALIFTKNGGCQSVGLLSQTYLENIRAQAVIVPIVPFNQQTMVVTEDSEASLAAILQHSIVNSVEQIHKHFDTIRSKKGTKIIIWNLRRAKDGMLEIDFETDESDFRMPAIQIEELKKGLKSFGSNRPRHSIPDMHYSLRAYLSILYLKPRTQIFLRGKKILAKLVSKRLVKTEHDVYKPHFSKEKVKVTFGLNPNNKEHYGVMLYHKNRLIKAYEKVGCQLKTSGQRAGIGVTGVIECNFLKPAHNKQDFEYTKEYRLTLGALGLKLNDYWEEVLVKRARERELQALDRDIAEVRQYEVPMWLQCEECLKWRSIPAGHYRVAPETWNCSQNPNPRYRSCATPEETEDCEELTPSYQKNHKKVGHHKSRKRGHSAEVHNPQNREAKYKGPLHSSERVQPNAQSSANRFDADEEAPLDAVELAGHNGDDRAPTNDDEQPQKAAIIARTVAKDESDLTPAVGTQGVKRKTQRPADLSFKRKSESPFYSVMKKRHLTKELWQDAENQTRSLQKQTNASQTPSHKADTSDSPNTPHETPTGHTRYSSLPSTQTVKVSPVSRTEGLQLPPEGGDREAKMQRLAVLEKESQKLRRLLSLENTLQGTTATANSSSGMPARGLAASCKEVGCQTDAAEGSTSFTNPAQAAGAQGLVALGQKVLSEPKEQPWQNGERTEKTEAQSRLRDAHSQSHEDSRSTEANLRDIRNNVVVLLTALLPQLDLTGISLETADVDSILEQIIDVNALRL